MLACTACAQYLFSNEPIHGLCEGCFTKHYIKPLEAKRAELFTQLSEVERQITMHSAKLAKRFDPRSNTPLKCACGAKFQSGLDLVAHTKVCTDRETAKKTTQAHQARVRPNVVY